MNTENIQEAIRTRLIHHLQGNGIEIGALHKPLQIEKRNNTQIKYIDRLSVEELRKQYPELNELPLVTPDIIDDGSTLEKIRNRSLDFIIANHLLEHLENPIKALENWLSKLKSHGIIYLALPDKRYTFDIDRHETSIDHLLEDYHASQAVLKMRIHEHYVETAEIIEKRTGDDARERVASLEARNYSIHHHVWSYVSFRKFLEFLMHERKLPFIIIDECPPQTGGDEFIFVIKKDNFAWLRRFFRNLWAVI